MPITEAGGPFSSEAPGKMPTKLEPMLLIWFKIRPCAPAPTAIIMITEEMPIIIPSMVKKVLSLREARRENDDFMVCNSILVSSE